METLFVKLIPSYIFFLVLSIGLTTLGITILIMLSLLDGSTQHSFFLPSPIMAASLVAQRLKRLPAMQETWVRSLGREDPLEKEMATHSSILAWRIRWMEEPGELQSTGLQSRTRLSDFTFTFKQAGAV